MNQWIVGDSTTVELPSEIGLVVADTPYGDHDTINAVMNRLAIYTCTQLYFMAPEDVWHLVSAPEVILHWVKQPSTKNTQHSYSRFVEVVVGRNIRLNPGTHWSARTGVFFDSLIQQPRHPHKKPDSLIEKLIANHYRSGLVLDPFAGSGTVHNVCKRLGIPSVSIEIEPRWSQQ